MGIKQQESKQQEIKQQEIKQQESKQQESKQQESKQQESKQQENIYAINATLDQRNAMSSLDLLSLLYAWAKLH
jgi:hypothetical protein